VFTAARRFRAAGLTSLSAASFHQAGLVMIPKFHALTGSRPARRLRLTLPGVIPGSRSGRLPVPPDAGRQLSAR